MRPRKQKATPSSGGYRSASTCGASRRPIDTRRRARLTINFTFALVASAFLCFPLLAKIRSAEYRSLYDGCDGSCLVGVPAIFHRTKSMAYAVNYLPCYFGVLNILIFIPGEFIRIQYLG